VSTVATLESKLWKARCAEAATVEDRTRLLLEVLSVETGHGAWAALEQRTGITAQRWRKAYRDRQRPTPDMLEALANQLPQYAFWLLTGVVPRAKLQHGTPADWQGEPA